MYILKHSFLLLLFFLICSSCTNTHRSKSNAVSVVENEDFNETIIAKPAKQKYTQLEKNLIADGFLNVETIHESIKVELPYETINNFTKQVLYDSLHHAFLRPFSYKKLKLAHQLLQEKNPHYTFMVYDALRPRSVQVKMWDIVKGTSQQKYVASPGLGSIHNYGLAIDLSIYDLENKQVLDMGTGFDFLGRAAEYRYNNQLVKEGTITQQAKENRILLRTVMKQAGFQPINSEWWHFNALSKDKTRAKYTIVE